MDFKDIFLVSNDEIYQEGLLVGNQSYLFYITILLLNIISILIAINLSFRNYKNWGKMKNTGLSDTFAPVVNISFSFILLFLIQIIQITMVLLNGDNLTIKRYIIYSIAYTPILLYTINILLNVRLIISNKTKNRILLALIILITSIIVVSPIILILFYNNPYLLTIMTFLVGPIISIPCFLLTYSISNETSSRHRKMQLHFLSYFFLGGCLLGLTIGTFNVILISNQNVNVIRFILFHLLHNLFELITLLSIYIMISPPKFIRERYGLRIIS